MCSGYQHRQAFRGIEQPLTQWHSNNDVKTQQLGIASIMVGGTDVACLQHDVGLDVEQLSHSALPVNYVHFHRIAYVIPGSNPFIHWPQLIASISFYASNCLKTAL